MGMHNTLHVRAWSEYYPIKLLKVGSLNTTLPVLIVHQYSEVYSHRSVTELAGKLTTLINLLLPSPSLVCQSIIYGGMMLPSVTGS